MNNQIMENLKHLRLKLYPDFYVYIHRRKTDNSVFYVGKGTGDRAWQLGSKRNTHWQRIVSKNGLIVELVETGLQDWYAQEREIELIAFYGRKNLCNQTDGGDGISGRIWSDESRAKLSAAKKGKPSPWSAGENSPMRRPEVLAKVIAARLGKSSTWIAGDKNPMHDPAIKAHHSALFKGKKRPDITGSNHVNAKKVRCIETGVIFDCLQDAAKWLRENGRPKATQSNISSACTGNLKTAYGYRWEHA